MRCLYCDAKISKFRLIDLVYRQDVLCIRCREQMVRKRRVRKIGDLEVMTFYRYDSLFKTLLLSYKECYDEALAPAFLYLIEIYLRLRYWGYQICYVPSTKAKMEERGFDHLEEIFGCLGMKKVEGLYLKKEIIQKGKGSRQREEIIDNIGYRGGKLGKVLIVDDVVTTGSSLKAVYKAIAPYAAKIRLVALANVNE